MRDRRAGRPSRGYRPRRLDARTPRVRFLIVCEGKVTEKNYFQAFKVAGAVKVLGLGDNTLSLVERAVALRDADDYDQAWCVFDRDSFPPDRFNRALELAEQQGLRVAYANEAFELWYLLHFEYCEDAAHRSQYEDRLTRHLGSRYVKNRPDLFERLEARQPDAARNAERLMRQYPIANPERDNPSTTVHLLVAELNRHRRP